MAQGPRLRPVTYPPLNLTRKQEKLIAAAADIRTARPTAVDFLHTVQC